MLKRTGFPLLFLLFILFNAAAIFASEATLTAGLNYGRYRTQVTRLLLGTHRLEFEKRVLQFFSRSNSSL